MNQDQPIQTTETPPLVTTTIEPEAKDVGSSKPNSNNKSVVLVLVLLILGLLALLAYLFFQNRQLQRELLIVSRNNSRFITDPEEKVSDLDKPTSNPTETWKVYTISDLGISYKLPPEVTKHGNPEEETASGESGTQRCWYLDSVLSGLISEVKAGGGACFDKVLWLGTNSTDYSAGRSGGFADFRYYIKGVDGYSVGIFDTEIKIPDELVTPIRNENGVEILKIVGADSTDPEAMSTTLLGTPGQGNVGALIRLNNEQYPMLTIQMNLSDQNTEQLFDQILSTFQFTE